MLKALVVKLTKRFKMLSAGAVATLLLPMTLVPSAGADTQLDEEYRGVFEGSRLSTTVLFSAPITSVSGSPCVSSRITAYVTVTYDDGAGRSGATDIFIRNVGTSSISLDSVGGQLGGLAPAVYNTSNLNYINTASPGQSLRVLDAPYGNPLTGHWYRPDSKLGLTQVLEISLGTPTVNGISALDCKVKFILFPYIRPPHNPGTYVHSLERLYRAYFGRVSDGAGLDYWVKRVSEDLSLAQVSSHFAGSGEFLGLYGNTSNRAFARRVYLNVLGREPDAAGWNFWTGQLNSGMARGELMLLFSDTPEFKRRTNLR